MKKILLTVSFVLLIALSAAQIFAQEKTDTPSPCVKFQFSDKNPNYVGHAWANQDYPPCKTAVNWLREASFTVLGRTLKPKDDDDIVQNYLLDIGAKPVWKAKFDAGLKQADAVAYIKATAKPGEYRIAQIFPEIYGRDITKFEDSLYKKAIETKELWYLKIYQNEFEKLWKDEKETEAVINRAFQKVRRRPAKPEEMKYWKKQGKVFKDIVATLLN